jgi:uncharacterized membrane protein YebE (DUF533 family)
MNLQALLEQLLKTGAGAVGQARDATAASARSGDLGKYATGAAVGGALAMLLGSRRGRSFGGKALKIGSVAALGTLAWKAYQDYQASQQAQTRAQPPGPAAGAPLGSGVGGFAALPAPQLEHHSQAMLRAMIAAAKSDGHMDERERQLVQTELDRLQADAGTRQWVEAELRKPVDPAEVAAGAQGPEMAAEIYLASRLVVDETTAMERAYLDELARQLRLAPELRQNLDTRAAEALG